MPGTMRVRLGAAQVLDRRDHADVDLRRRAAARRSCDGTSNRSVEAIGVRGRGRRRAGARSGSRPRRGGAGLISRCRPKRAVALDGLERGGADVAADLLERRSTPAQRAASSDGATPRPRRRRRRSARPAPASGRRAASRPGSDGMLSASSRASATCFTSSYPVVGDAADHDRGSGAKARKPPSACLQIARRAATSATRAAASACRCTVRRASAEPRAPRTASSADSASSSTIDAAPRRWRRGRRAGPRAAGPGAVRRTRAASACRSASENAGHRHARRPPPRRRAAPRQRDASAAARPITRTSRAADGMPGSVAGGGSRTCTSTRGRRSCRRRACGAGPRRRACRRVRMSVVAARSAASAPASGFASRQPGHELLQTRLITVSPFRRPARPSRPFAPRSPLRGARRPRSSRRASATRA